jgi:hypothetical protein
MSVCFEFEDVAATAYFAAKWLLPEVTFEVSGKLGHRGERDGTGGTLQRRVSGVHI